MIKQETCPNCGGCGVVTEYIQTGEDACGYAIGEEIPFECALCEGHGFIMV